MTYNRPWKSFEDQLDLLKSRGMSVSDEAAAVRCLERIGYYRLSAYWYPFRVFEVSQDPGSGALATIRTDRFVTGTEFVDALELYLFDKKLRLIVLDALERIEIALRVDVAYVLGKHDPFAHMSAAALHPGFAGKWIAHADRSVFDGWREKYDGLLKRSKEDFVKHYRQKHGPDLPIWVAVEVLDFGAVSQLLAMMKVHNQQRIAAKYGVGDWKVFQSWLRSLNYLRNLAAHHSRVWNRNVIDQPKLPQPGRIGWCDAFIGKPDLIAKPFLLLGITRHMLQALYPRTSWATRLREHLLTFPDQSSSRKLSIADMGAPEAWRKWWA